MLSTRTIPTTAPLIDAIVCSSLQRECQVVVERGSRRREPVTFDDLKGVLADLKIKDDIDAQSHDRSRGPQLHKNRTRDEPLQTNRTRDEPLQTNRTRDKPLQTNRTRDKPLQTNRKVLTFDVHVHMRIVLLR